MRRLLSILALISLLASAGNAHADEPPPDDHLVYAGLAMAVPTYWINLVLHEGSHAAVAKACGAEIVRFSVLPGRYRGNFYFGYVEYRGRLSLREQTLFLLAPKLVDGVALAGFTTLLALDGMPDNHYGRLALTVMATGFWLDLTKDIFMVWSLTDVERAFRKHELDSFWSRLPWRMLHLGASVAAGYVVLQGYDQVFEDDSAGGAAPVIAPLLQGRF